jgi:hypothetical protein
VLTTHHPSSNLPLRQKKLAPQSIPYASIVGYLVALDRAARRTTAASAGIVGHRAS